MRVIVFSLICLCGSAHGQVIKCIDPQQERRVAYTDGACPAGWRPALIERERTAVEIQQERQRAQQAIADKNRRLQRERFEADINAAQEPAPAVTQGPAINQFECERARRNAETSASSITSRRPGDKYAEREMNIKCFGTAEAGKIERARAGAPRVTVVNPHPPTITHCAGAYCYDSQGGTHLMPGR